MYISEKRIVIKKNSNAIWTGVFTAICLICYFLIPATKNFEGFKNAGLILIGATLAYLSDAIPRNKND